MAQELVKIDREAVRVLALSIGVREAARKLGLNEDRVRNWSSRFKWFNGKEMRGVKPAETSVTRLTPGDVLLDEIKNNERETRVSLSRSCRNMASQAEKAPLKSSGSVLKVAQTFAILHPPEQNKSTLLNLSVLVNNAPNERPNEKQIKSAEDSKSVVLDESS